MSARCYLLGAALFMSLAAIACQARSVSEQDKPVLSANAHLLVRSRSGRGPIICWWESNHQVVLANVAKDETEYVIYDLNTGKQRDYWKYKMAQIGTHQPKQRVHAHSQAWNNLPKRLQATLTSQIKSLPPGAKIVDALLSPFNQSCILTVEYTRTVATDLTANDAQPAAKPHTIPYVALWTVQQDGSKPHLLGVQPGPPDSDIVAAIRVGSDICDLIISFVYWSPDETRIAFVHKDGVYVLPVR